MRASAKHRLKEYWKQIEFLILSLIILTDVKAMVNQRNWPSIISDANERYTVPGGPFCTITELNTL